MITITDAAITQVKSYLEEDENKGKALRLFAEAGGCSGYQYGLAFDDVQEDDTEMDFSGVKIVVDGQSANVVKGVDIDFVESLQGSGFKISNPSATGTCGCGSSFEV